MSDQILNKIIVRPSNETDRAEISNFDEYFPIALSLCNKDDLIFVVELEKIIIGYFILQKGKEPAYFDDNQKNWAEIIELQVHPQYQRKGVGTFLMLFAIERAKEKGYSKVYVCTDDFNKAGRRLYQKCGFQELNRIIRNALNEAVNSENREDYETNQEYGEAVAEEFYQLVGTGAIAAELEEMAEELPPDEYLGETDVYSTALQYVDRVDYVCYAHPAILSPLMRLEGSDGNTYYVGTDKMACQPEYRHDR